MNAAPPQVSCAGIVFKNGAVFAVRRSAPGIMQGTWEFPGGKVEDGETVEAALVREFAEELDARVECGELLAQTSFVHKGVERRLAAHRIYFVSESFTLREHSEFRWLTRAQALGLNWTPSDYAILTQLEF